MKLLIRPAELQDFPSRFLRRDWTISDLKRSSEDPPPRLAAHSLIGSHGGEVKQQPDGGRRCQLPSRRGALHKRLQDGSAAAAAQRLHSLAPPGSNLKPEWGGGGLSAYCLSVVVQPNISPPSCSPNQRTFWGDPSLCQP